MVVGRMLNRKVVPFCGLNPPGADIRGTVSPGEVIEYLREHEITLTWNPASAALQARGTETAKTVTIKAS